MFNWTDIKEQEAHQQDLLREAALDRLARQARPQPDHPAPRIHWPYRGIGRVLISKGLDLISG